MTRRRRPPATGANSASTMPADVDRSRRLPASGAGHVRRRARSGVHRRRVERGDQPAAQHHRERVRQADQLVQVGGDRAGCASPSARASRSWSQMAACAPTSTPRVGWAAISSRGLADSSPGRRSASAGCRRTARRPARRSPGSGRRTPRTIRSVSARAALPVDEPALGRRAARVWWPRIRFSQSGASSSRPCRCRSSGMNPMPASRRRRVDQARDVLARRAGRCRRPAGAGP